MIQVGVCASKIRALPIQSIGSVPQSLHQLTREPNALFSFFPSSNTSVESETCLIPGLSPKAHHKEALTLIENVSLIHATFLTSSQLTVSLPRFLGPVSNAIKRTLRLTKSLATSKSTQLLRLVRYGSWQGWEIHLGIYLETRLQKSREKTGLYNATLKNVCVGKKNQLNVKPHNMAPEIS